MREIKYIVIHCTATPQTVTVESIKRYWRDNLGWKSPGYHFLILPDGKVENLQPIEKPANGVAGFNANSIHISYIGGVDRSGKPVDNRTIQQKREMLSLALSLKKRFPKAIIQGHRDFPNVAKACPSFDAKKEFQMIIG